MQPVLAALIIIGDELTSGYVSDVNTPWLCSQLNQIGIQVNHIHIIGDQVEAIIQAIRDAQKQSQLIITTGGLGPTSDDVTKQALSHCFGMSASVLTQAFISDDAVLPPSMHAIASQTGTSGAIWYAQTNQVLIALPGVPAAVKQLMQETILSRLQQYFPLPHIEHYTIHTVGLSETELMQKLKPWIATLPESIKLAYLPSLGTVTLRLTIQSMDKNQSSQVLTEQVSEVKKLIGPYIYGEQDTTLAATVGQLLKAQNQTIATAESCTAGYVAHLMTSVAGSSAYYQGGLIAYQNKAKIEVLGVQTNTLAQHGAVSEATVLEMAQQVKAKFNATIGLATTGLAGPTGGTQEKPVGTIWIALIDQKETYTQRLQCNGNRLENIQLTAVYLLDSLRKVLQGIQPFT